MGHNADCETKKKLGRWRVISDYFKLSVYEQKSKQITDHFSKTLRQTNLLYNR